MIVCIGFVLFQEDDSSFLPIIGFYSVWRCPDKCPEVSRISGPIFYRKSSEMSIYTVQKFRFISNVNYFDFPSKIRSGRIFHHTKSRVFWCPDMCPEIRDMCPEFRTFSRNGCFRCPRASPVCLKPFYSIVSDFRTLWMSPNRSEPPISVLVTRPKSNGIDHVL